MINFFRKIRKKMADDNKPMKYMRYAVGEIVLESSMVNKVFNFEYKSFRFITLTVINKNIRLLNN